MKKVLIVDDERAFLSILSEGLKSYEQEFQLLTAENGRDAVALLQREPVDLVVTDIKMPQMDGFELLQHLNKSFPALPVMLMTAFGTQEMEEKGMALGARQYLEKPFDVDTLVKKILNELRRELGSGPGGGGPASGERELTVLALQRDDEARRFCERLKPLEKFVLLTASSDQELLEMYAASNVDLLLVPLTDPLTWQLVERFVAKHPFTPVAVAGRARDYDELHRALRLGAAEFLTYGDPPAEIGAALAQAVARARDLKRSLKSQVKISYESEIERMQYEMSHELNRVFSMQDEYEHNRFQMVKVLVNALQINDPYESGHSERVAIKAKNIAKSMNQAYLMSHGIFDLKELEMAGLLHDIGKLGVPKNILNHKGPLTGDDWAIIKRHTILGAEIVSKNDNLKTIADPIRHHHERWDGGGYPDGLQGEKIPLISRILSLADAFDAMVSPRVYRQALGLPDIVREIKQNSGKQFDPEVVNGMLMSIGDY